MRRSRLQIAKASVLPSNTARYCSSRACTPASAALYSVISRVNARMCGLPSICAGAHGEDLEHRFDPLQVCQRLARCHAHRAQRMALPVDERESGKAVHSEDRRVEVIGEQLAQTGLERTKALAEHARTRGGVE